MKAKELYRFLDSELKPLLAKYGFKKQRASRLVYQRTVADTYHSVWFQCDKYGWDAVSGGKFFVNFTVSETTDVEGPRRRDERLNFFLTDAELVFARKHNDEIVSRIPRPPESYFETLLTGFSRSVPAESAASLVETVRGYFERSPMPYQRHQDFALRYWLPRDVIVWARFVESVVPRAIEQMESWSVPHRADG
jgi:hypothetical protein